MSQDKYAAIDSHLIAASQLLAELEGDAGLPRFKRAEAMEFRARLLGMRASIWPQSQPEETYKVFGSNEDDGDVTA